jgi:hypothetical protein
MIKLIPKIPDAELFNIFSKFYKDPHDSVRMPCIDSCATFAQLLSPEKLTAHLLPYIKRQAED